MNREPDVGILGFFCNRKTIAVVVCSFPILGHTGALGHFFRCADIRIAVRIGIVAATSILPRGTTESIPLQVVVRRVFRFVHNLNPRDTSFARVPAFFARGARILTFVAGLAPVVPTAAATVAYCFWTTWHTIAVVRLAIVVLPRFAVGPILLDLVVISLHLLLAGTAAVALAATRLGRGE